MSGKLLRFGTLVTIGLAFAVTLSACGSLGLTASQPKHSKSPGSPKNSDDQTGTKQDGTQDAGNTQTTDPTKPDVGTTQLTWDGQSFVGSSRFAIITIE